MTFFEALTRATTRESSVGSAHPREPVPMRRRGWDPNVRVVWDPDLGWCAASDYSPIFASLSGAFVHLLSPENLTSDDWEVIE